MHVCRPQSQIARAAAAILASQAGIFRGARFLKNELP